MIQTEADGTIEGPAVTQTIAGHAQMTVPAGVVCFEDATGVQTHALLLTSSVQGLQVQSGVQMLIGFLSPRTP